MSQNASYGADGVLELDSGLEALRTSPEFRGPVEPLEGHHCNDHLALIFESREEQFASIVPFIRQGLERGERCMYVIDELSRGEILAAMREGGVDVDAALESGALSFHAVEETYLRNGTFEPDEMIEFYASTIEEATEGYDGLRIAAETTWLQEEETTIEDFMEYEAKVNDLFEGEDCIALCQYDRNAFPPEVVRDIIQTHPHLIYEGTVCHNFYHTPPEEFFGPDHAAREVDRMIGTLVERTQAKTELQDRERFLRELNDITARQDLSFEEKLQAVFELGCERFGLGFGFLNRVDPDADHLEIEYASDDHEHYKVGGELPLSETYCKAAVDIEAAADIANPADAGYDDLFVYEEFGVDGYLGTYIPVVGDADRTLAFVPDGSYKKGFSEQDKAFIELMGQWVGYELNRRQRERFLRECHEITSDPTRSFEEKLDALFEAGCEFFDLDHGGIARIDPADDYFEVEAISGEHDHLVPDEQYPLSETYCRLATDDGETATVTDPVGAGFEGSLCYDRFGVRAYLGTHLPIDGDVDRTFWFVSNEPRDTPITDEQRTFHHLMGQWVKYELERRQREQELRRTKNRFETVFENSNDAIFLLDPYEDELVDANPAVLDLLGYDRDELLARRPSDLHPDEMDEFRAFIDTVFENGHGWTEELSCRAKTGEKIPVEISASSLELEDRALMLALVRDVSERKKHERYQRDLYAITSDPDLPFEEKLERLLELGRERFDLEMAGVSHLPPGDEEFRVETGVGLDVDPADEPLWTDPDEGCYCRQTITAEEPVGRVDVRDTDWTEDTIYRELGLTSYLGTKISTRSGPYGTLWFGSTDPRDRPFSEAERTFIELMGQWTSYELEREHREAQLGALNAMGRDLMDAETTADIAEVAIEHAAESLGLPLTTLVAYDEETGRIEPAARTPRAADEIPTAALCNRGEGALWDTFVAEEVRTVDDVASIPGASEDVTEILAVPLGRQGLFVVGTRADDGFSAAERDFVEATAATVEAAFTRADREQQLHERERTLEEQNETLQRLDRINDIIRNIDQALVQAANRGEIEAVVCEQLAESGPYELAWIGEHDPVTGEVSPRQWAGTAKGYLEGITVTVDDRPTGQGPTGQAIKTYEPQVVNDILDDASFEPWRQAALNRGYHASMALPLVYEDTLYGVLNVYAGQPGVFDELERTVLSELSDNVAHAINAVESKKALVSDEVVELEFEVRDTDHPLVALTEEADCEVALEGLVPRTDGQLRAFVSTWGVGAEQVIEAHPPTLAPEVDLVSHGERDGEPACLFEVELTDESISGVVLEHGGVVREITAEDGTAAVLVELSADAVVREFVEMFRTRYPDSELVAKRARERRRRTLTELHGALTEELTPRQREVLQTAYFSGYFDQPRARTGSEIAESLDIAQPTFNSHLRAAQRKLCRELFERSLRA